MKTSRSQHLSILAALAVAASGFAAFATSAAPLPTAPIAGPVSKVEGYTSYRQCLGARSQACLFPGPLGPELPNTPEEEAIYEQCLNEAVTDCLAQFPPS